MRPDDRVLVDDGLTPLHAAPANAVVDLLDARVHGLEPVQALLEPGGQAIVGLGGVGKERVAARVRAVEDVQEGRAGRLLLVGDVAVPGDGARARLEQAVEVGVARGAVHEVHLGEVLGRTRGRVDVVAAKVGAVVEGLVDGQVGKVLVAEGDDLALGDEAGELVLAGVGQAAQLDAVDLGADGGREVCDLGAGGQEVREGRVRILAVVVVIKVLERRVFLVGVPCGQVIGILSRAG